MDTEKLGGYSEAGWLQKGWVDTERLGGYREAGWVQRGWVGTERVGAHTERLVGVGAERLSGYTRVEVDLKIDNREISTIIF